MNFVEFGVLASGVSQNGHRRKIFKTYNIALAEIKMKDLMLTEKDSGELAIALESSENILKRLERLKDATTDYLLEIDKELSYVQNWSEKAKSAIQPFRKKRQELKKWLEIVREEEREAKLEKELAINKKFGEFTQPSNPQGKDEWSSAKPGKVQAVKLQKYTISPFHGEYKDWLRFCNQFMVEVDGSSIAEISKFNYVIELVKGKPKEYILGLPHTPEGYIEAKKILEHTYGKDIRVHGALIKDLEELQPITDIKKLWSVHSFYNKLARIVRTLTTMNN